MKSKLHRQTTTIALALLLGASTVQAQSDSRDNDMKMARNFMQTAQAFVQSAVGGSGNVLVTIDGDTATLIGVVESLLDKQRAELAAFMDMRVSTVKNHIVTSN